VSATLRLFVVFVLAMAAQWWWSTHGAIAGVAPQLLLVLTVAVAARYGPLYAMTLGFFWGLFGDVLAARLVGANALALTLVAYVTGSLRRQVDLLGLAPQMLLIAGLTLGYFVFMGLMGLVFLRSFLWVGWPSFVVDPFYNCFVAVLVYGFFEAFMEPAR
jgi:rod shape-determining protein MreD